MKCWQIFLICSIALIGCENERQGQLKLLHAFVGTIEISLTEPATTGLPLDRSITLVFSSPPNPVTIDNAVQLKVDEQVVAVTTNVSGNSITIFPATTLSSGAAYVISISDQLRGGEGQHFSGIDIMFKTALQDIQVASLHLGGKLVAGNDIVTNAPLDLSIIIDFSNPVDENLFQSAIKLVGTNVPALTATLSSNNKTGTITASALLKDFSKYTFTILSSLKGSQGEDFSEYSLIFYTGASETPKFPVITDDELLTLVQQQTFKYFYDFAHPASGMARERNSSSDLVTSGGSGFGIMALIVGMERGFITRQQGLDRMDKTLDFLETADRFHGAWSHWIDGNTGDVIPFSANDNGGDLVETSFLIQGLITFRQYLNSGDTEENILISRINTLWQGVEWDWYRRNNQDVLYWHWSSDKDWVMNHQIKGWNECMITYVLAAASPTHSIPEVVYDAGWASNGSMQNGNSYEGIQLPLGEAHGGPLFFSHYSFLGLDPRNLSDVYANYFTQNVNHTRINYNYCVRNPKKFVGYSDACWGLTASDNQNGYSAHSPTNDLGVITPTGALSSFPYTPEESMRALKFFYYTLGDRLWGEYGFYDSFNITAGWTADSYLAIDQGPIIVMIENYRTGLLWNLFMSCPELEVAKDKLGLIY